METDRYRTIANESITTFREKASKFISYSFKVTSEEHISERLAGLKKKYFDATHHCYAWRIGTTEERSRSNDDGEPSGTAGKPILGQILSRELTNVLVVVVRYFGGTKLGTGGLVQAYKQGAAQVLDESGVEECLEKTTVALTFPYIMMNHVMKQIKSSGAEVVRQHSDTECRITVSIRSGGAPTFIDSLGESGDIRIEIQ